MEKLNQSGIGAHSDVKKLVFTARAIRNVRLALMNRKWDEVQVSERR